jgi:site-specific DNA recombinase
VQVIEAGAYLRISLDWTGKELGVTRQREDCQRIADRLGWKIGDWYIDNNKGASRRSRSKGSRDEYQRLLADIEAGLVKAVIIWMEDRLHRQVIELAEFLKVCEAAGVTRIASVGGRGSAFCEAVLFVT